MLGKNQGLSVIVVERPNPSFHGGYKYLVRRHGAQPYAAFRTDRGYELFLERSNVRPELAEDFETPNGRIWVYDLHGEIEERSFWNLSEIPLDAKPFKGLSNGYLVDCYYLHTHCGSIIYRPNPNAKQVYNPLPIDEHIEYMRVYG
ncbi:MAG: hypothetical protein K6T83_03735 [Alicyclobacillus sp.]|nr:hypothetical protein [Alicyclobacillus sp.]